MISRDILYELDPAYYDLIFSYDKVFANEFEILQKKKSQGLWMAKNIKTTLETNVCPMKLLDKLTLLGF